MSFEYFYRKKILFGFGKYKVLILFVFPPFLFTQLSAQSKKWEVTVGGKYNDFANSIIQCADKGYAITGGTYSFNDSVNGDVYIIKLDSNGVLKWTRTIGGSGVDLGYSIIQTKDKGYAVSGFTSSYGAGRNDFYVIKLDSVGNLQWTKTIGGNGDDESNSIVQTRDGGYGIAGTTYSYDSGNVNAYIVKLDSSGNFLWSKIIGTGLTWGFYMIGTKDGGFMITGLTNNCNISVYRNYLALKLDSMGNIQWEKSVGGDYYDYGYSVIQTKDGGYALTGWSDSFISGVPSLYVVKLDSSGTLQWGTAIGNYNNGYSIVQCNDGGYIAAGWSQFYGAGYGDVYLVKLDSSGVVLWTKTFGGDSLEKGYSIITTEDKGYAVAGFTKSYGSGNEDVYIIKLDSNISSCLTSGSGGIIGAGGSECDGAEYVIYKDSGNVGSGGIVDSGGILTNVCDLMTSYDTKKSVTNHLEIFPNPSSGIFTIQLSEVNVPYSIEVFNVLGEKVFSQSKIPIRTGTGGQNSTSKIDLSSQPNGIYFYRVFTESGGVVSSGKIVVEK